MEYFSFLFLKQADWFESLSETCQGINGGKTKWLDLATFIVFAFFRSRKKENKNLLVDPEYIPGGNDGIENIIAKCRIQISGFLHHYGAIYQSGFDSFINEDLTDLKNTVIEKETLEAKDDSTEDALYETAAKLESDFYSGHYFIELKDYQTRMISSLNLIVKSLYDHINNSHRPFIKTQVEELKKLGSLMKSFLVRTAGAMDSIKTKETEILNDLQKNIQENLTNMEVAQIKRIKAHQINTRNSELFLSLVSETKNILTYVEGLLNSYQKLTNQVKK